MKKKRPVKSTWYDWLMNYIPEPIRKIVGSLRDKVVSLFKANTHGKYGKQTVHGKEKN